MRIIKALVSLIICFVLSSANNTEIQEKTPKVDSIKPWVKAHKYHKVSEALGKFKTKDSLKKLHRLAQNEHCVPLQNAIQAAHSLKALRPFSHISKTSLVQTAFFVETKLPATTKHNRFYSADKRGIACDVEYDAKTKQRVLSLRDSDKNVIGKGAKKVVMKAVLYDAHHPQLVARCDQSMDDRLEYKITKHVQGGPGVVKILGRSHHYDHGKIHNVLFCKYYKYGSLSRFFFDNLKEAKFTLKEKMGICHNILTGLEKLQKNNIIHRDLCAANCLIDINNGSKQNRKIDVVLADFGSARFRRDVTGLLPEGHSCYIAPEGVYYDEMSSKDYFKTDLFAAGAVFHWLFYEKQPYWLKNNIYRNGESKSKRYKMLAEIVEKQAGKRYKELKEKYKKQGYLSRKELFESMILKMLNVDPGKRGAPQEHKLYLEQLMQGL